MKRPLTSTSARPSKVVAKVFSKSGNTFLNIGATYPNQTFTGWIPPASPVNKSPILSGIEGKKVEITGRIEMYKGKPEIRINDQGCTTDRGGVIACWARSRTAIAVRFLFICPFVVLG
jgi:hypothetical protein